MQGESSGPADKGRVIMIDHETPPIGTGTIIGNQHRMEISGRIQGDEGEGVLGVDAVKPKLNEFGDMMPHHGDLTKAPIKFKLIGSVDPTGRGRKIYLISGGGFERMGIRCSLVTENDSPARFVIKDRDEHTALPLTKRIRQ
jgi:hypothetical protein